MPYWRLHNHLVWATKGRSPLITPDVARELYGYLRGKAAVAGCVVHAIGGIEDHVHLVLSIPPRHSIAEIVKLLKGGSAYHLRHTSTVVAADFAWQGGYGALSLSSKQLAGVVAYVERQPEHHRQQTIIRIMETSTEDENGPLAPAGTA